MSAGVVQENFGNSLNTAVGLPQLSDNPRDFGLSFITVTGFSPLGDEFNNPQQSTTDMFEVLDTLTYARGRHLMKVGFDARFTRQDAFRDVQSRGLLTFSAQPAITGNALADLLLGLPLITGGATLDNPQALRTESYNLFVQNEIRLRPNLTVSAGLRYEVTSPPVDAEDRANVFDPVSQSLVQVGTNGVPRSGYATDYDNVATRLGFAWTPGASADTVVRGGYGIYYNQSALAPSEGLYFNPPFFDFNLFFQLPDRPLTLNDPFPSQFPFVIPPSAVAFDRALRTPWLQQWSVGVQHQLGSRRAVEIAYVGSKGHNLLTARDINQADASPNPFNPRPNPAFGDIIAQESSATSRYDALQLRVQQRTLGGLSLHAAYTFGKSTDDASDFFTSAGDPNFPQDSNKPRAERGRSNFDVRHRFSTSFSYALPFGPGRRFASGDGWALPDPGRLDGGGDLHGTKRSAVHRGDPAGDRQQQHRAGGAGVRRERPAESGRQSHAVESVGQCLVRYRRIRVSCVRQLRRRRPEHPGWAWIPEPQSGRAEAGGDRRGGRPAATARGVQPPEPGQPGLAGCLPRLTNLRPHPVGRPGPAAAARREIDLLGAPAGSRPSK